MNQILDEPDRLYNSEVFNGIFYC